MCERVLITGGAGFIGVPLVEALLDAGHQVAILDNFRWPGRRELLPHHASLTVYEGDIRNAKLVRHVATTFQPSVVHHLAAIHYIPECEKNPSEAVGINVLGTQVLLECLRSLNVKRVFLASTSSVYLSTARPYREDDPLGPGDIYGVTKFAAEMLLRQHQQTTGQSCVITRFFNVYGENETNQHVIPVIVEQLKVRTERIQLGKLDSRRDFIFVEDLVDALLRLMDMEGVQMEAFNIGSGTAYSIQQVVHICAELLGQKIVVDVVPGRLRKVDPPLLQARIAKLHEATGWQPRHDFRSGLGVVLRSEGLIP